MGGGLWFVVDVGDVLPEQRPWGQGTWGVGAALRCKHFEARGKEHKNRPDGPAKMSYGAIGKAGAGASGSYQQTDFVSCRNLRKRCGCE